MLRRMSFSITRPTRLKETYVRTGREMQRNWWGDGSSIPGPRSAPLGRLPVLPELIEAERDEDERGFVDDGVGEPLELALSC